MPKYLFHTTVTFVYGDWIISTKQKWVGGNPKLEELRQHGTIGMGEYL